MIKDEISLLLVSSSTHYIMKLEKELQNFGICCRIIPLPSEISAGCGLSIKINLQDRSEVENLIKRENLQVELYLVEKHGFKKEVHKI